MKPTSEILERIEKCSTSHKDGVFTRLYRYLLREDLYHAAYQKLYANNGSMTKGMDSDIADGSINVHLMSLIDELRNGAYTAKPVKREYVKRENGKMRLLGKPSFRDKLLLGAVRMILEAIYEPIFDSHSHGFRPNKSCHTALKQIKADFTGVKWFIEGNTKGCLDSINHEKLIEILTRKIKDCRFLNVIRQFLKSGYIEDWVYNNTHSGCPLGGICSQILANIYLNELDKKFREIEERFNQPPLAHKENKLDDNKKFTFVRYADAWLAGVCGSKEDCVALKAEISKFLTDELKLTLSEEKTLITHSSENVRFLGYDISVRRSQEVRGHKMKNGTWRKSRTLHMKVALTIPHRDKIEKVLFEKGVIRQKPDGKFEPIHRASLLNLADYEIVEHYNAETRGLCSYYNLACDYHTLNYFCYLMEYSCLKTIANKHKSSVRKAIKKYKDGKTWSVPYETREGTTRVKPVKIADCKGGEVDDVVFQRKSFN